MCTLTYVPQPNGRFTLTVNRDEGIRRAPAVPPRRYEEAGVTLYYPKDGQAGGTWLGISERQRAIDLLNGGFTAHKWEPPYRMSRGLLVRQALVAPDLYAFCQAFEHEGMEPFTLVAVEWKDEQLVLFQWVWDGEKLHWDSLDAQQSYIWSSSPLYDAQDQLLRQRWWADFLEKQAQPQPEDLWRFHHEAGVGNPRVDVCMRRPKVQTVSISQLYWEEGWQLRYEDVRNQSQQQVAVDWAAQ